MANVRRGGSASVFFFEGNLPSLQSETFEAALTAHRFRTIESAASEEISIGWVSPNDPSGDSFPREDHDLETAIWLQIRVDKKKLPMRWVAIHRAAAERAAGRKLNGKERKALKEDLQETLLPRILPAVQILDVLVDPKGKRALLFSTSKGMREEFAKLWRLTFAANELVPASAFEWARQGKLTAAQRTYLDEVSPVTWPRLEPRRQPAVEHRGETSEAIETVATTEEIDA